MKVKLDFKRRFKINGKKYNSLENVPQNIMQAREACRKLMDSQEGSDPRINSVVTPNKIRFNGMGYQKDDAMAIDLFQQYKKVPKTAELESSTSGADIVGISNGMLCNANAGSAARLGEIRKAIKGESSLPPRTLIVTGVMIALSLLIYYLLSNK